MQSCVSTELQEYADLLESTTGDGPLFAHLPGPWSITKINAKVVFYHTDGDKRIRKLHDLTASGKDKNPKKLVAKLKTCERLVLVTHGFLSSIEEDWLKEMRDTLLTCVDDDDDQVVALVGWGDGAMCHEVPSKKFFKYKQAAANCLKVGEWLAKEVVALVHSTHSSDIFVWGIGHSLGAHLMGAAGIHTNSANMRHGFKFDRITGLDPAGPGFQTGLKGYRKICKDDATFVDIIHTDGGLEPVYLGTLIPLGTIDFYPNFGYGTVAPQMFSLNHSLAYKLFIWSMKNRKAFQTCDMLLFAPSITKFPGGVIVHPCRETTLGNGEGGVGLALSLVGKPRLGEPAPMAEMGYYADQCPGKRGLYYIKVKGAEPYAKIDRKATAKVCHHHRPGRVPSYSRRSCLLSTPLPSLNFGSSSESEEESDPITSRWLETSPGGSDGCFGPPRLDFDPPTLGPLETLGKFAMGFVFGNR